MTGKSKKESESRGLRKLNALKKKVEARKREERSTWGGKK